MSSGRSAQPPTAAYGRQSGLTTVMRITGGLRTRNAFHRTGSVDRPLVTIVTVVRNGADFLERTLQSVARQTYENIEHIVLDGASTDGTVELIRKFEDRIAYWASEPDRGIYDAMNKGIALASGEWINFMNAGDTFYDVDTVQKMMESGCSFADLMYGDCLMRYSPESSMVWRARSSDKLWRGMICRHQSLFVRKNVCESIQFDLSYRIGADFDFIFRCQVQGYRFCRTDLVIASVDVGGYSDITFIKAIAENRRTVRMHLNRFKVDLFYFGLMVFTLVKRIVKIFLPKRLKHVARMLKFRFH